MKDQVYVLVGTSRKPGNSWLIADYLEASSNVKVIDLQAFNISYFDYEHKNQTDDFLPLMRNMLKDARTVLFVTPIYWYTMSAIMKTFFDRLSDLLKIEKELGRQLRGVSMSVISNSESDDAPEHFDEPFLLSAKYLGMPYVGCQHIICEQGRLSRDEQGKLDRILVGLGV